MRCYKWTKLWRNLGWGTQRKWRKQRWLTGKDSCILRIGAINYVPILKPGDKLCPKSLDTIDIHILSIMFIFDIVGMCYGGVLCVDWLVYEVCSNDEL